MRRLRHLASRVLRGPHAELIKHDLEDLYAHDRARGMSIWRAHCRYGRNLLGSAISTRSGRWAWPRLPRVTWLDVKLAIRMLVRYPGLTIVGGLALAIGIPVTLAPTHLLLALNAPLPFDPDHRVVGLETWLAREGYNSPATILDFELWKRDLTSIASVAAARRRVENVIGDDARVEVAHGCEMSAAAFDVPGVKPVIGRTLLASDELPGSAPVAVIGYDLWHTFFDGSPDVIGRTLRFGSTIRRIVGVMPEGFLFPYRDRFWLPFQDRATLVRGGRNPEVWVFGRLRDGVTWEQAQAELTTVGQRVLAEYPEPDANRRPVVTEFAFVVTGLTARLDRAYPVFLMSLLLLCVTCGNIGTLTLARAATRANEIAVRSALGAGRTRIVMQLFIEALVLSTLSAGVGVVLAQVAITRMADFQRVMPYWFDLGIRPVTIAVIGGLAVFSAVVTGLLPALKATGRRGYQALQRQSTGASGLRFGAVATVMIVLEVAIAVGGLSGVSAIARGAFRDRSIGEGIAAEEYLTTKLELPAGLPGRVRPIQTEITRRLLSEPGVRAVTFGSTLPGMDHMKSRVEVEVERGGAAPPASRIEVVRAAYIDLGFFETLGQRVIVGRNFGAGDLSLAPPERPFVVNRSFVDQLLDGQSPIGRRIRYVRPADQAPAPWREIVGVVPDLGMNIVDPERAAGIYQVVGPSELHSLQLLVRVNDDATPFVSRLRTIVTSVDPSIVLPNPVSLDDVFSEQLWEARLSSVAFVSIALIAVVLSAAGLYALMSFSVSQRTREIAIRTALGASVSRVVYAVVGRAALQLLVGVALGTGVAAAIVPHVLSEFTLRADWRLMLAVVAAAMAVTGLAACAVPTRRALRIQPVQALRDS